MNTRAGTVWSIALLAILLAMPRCVFAEAVEARFDSGVGYPWDNSGSFVDKEGKSWPADWPYGSPDSCGVSGGKFSDLETSEDIQRTDDDPLYQSSRTGSFSYLCEVPNGTYLVTLKFSENIVTQAGKRLFEVNAEGKIVLDRFDILREVPPKTALDKRFEVSVADGTLSLQFSKESGSVYDATVSAVEIVFKEADADQDGQPFGYGDVRDRDPWSHGGAFELCEPEGLARDNNYDGNLACAGWRRGGRCTSKTPRLQAPLNVTGKPGDRKAFLAWALPPKGSPPAGVLIYRGGRPIGYLYGVATSYVDRYIPNGTTVSYQAALVNDCGKVSPLSPTVTVTPWSVALGEPQRIFDWDTRGCEARSVYPDMPMRLARLPNGTLIMTLASSPDTHLMRGPDLDHLKPDCTPVLVSADDSDPSQFQPDEWLDALWTLPNGATYFTIHNEYHGAKYGERDDGHPCDEALQDCQYESVTAGLCDPGAFSCRHAHEAPGHWIASSQYQYAAGDGHTGISGGSNIVYDPTTARYFKTVLARNKGAQVGGNCLLMNDGSGGEAALTTGWKAQDPNGNFTRTFMNPYTQPDENPFEHACSPLDLVHPGVITGLFRQRGFENRERWMAIMTLSKFKPEDPHVLFAYSFAYQPEGPWSTPHLIQPVEQTWTWVEGDPSPTAYPTAVDPSSDSPNFDTVGSTMLFLYSDWEWYGQFWGDKDGDGQKDDWMDYDTHDRNGIKNEMELLD